MSLPPKEDRLLNFLLVSLCHPILTRRGGGFCPTGCPLLLRIALSHCRLQKPWGSCPRRPKRPVGAGGCPPCPAASARCRSDKDFAAAAGPGPGSAGGTPGAASSHRHPPNSLSCPLTLPGAGRQLAPTARAKHSPARGGRLPPVKVM